VNLEKHPGLSKPGAIWRGVIVILLLIGVTLAVFAPVLSAEFLNWDDDINISANPRLGPLTWHQLKWAFTDFNFSWRYQPLSWVTWSAIRTVAGLAPWAYHLAVLVFHAGNTVLVFLLIRRLLSWSSPAPAPAGRMICAALAAGLWALHPMRVETVAWAVELVFVQSTFFFLLALLAYLRAAQAGGSSGRSRFPWAAFGWFVASLLSYPLALGGLVVFVVLDFYPLRRLDGSWRAWFRHPARRVWVEKAPFLLVILTIALGGLYARTHHAGTAWPKPPTLEEFGLLSRLMQAFYIWAHYLWKPWVPFHLSPVYTTLVQFETGDWPFVLSAALVVGLTIVMVWNHRRWPVALGAWISYLALLVPVLGLTEHPHYPSDRYSYVPGILWSLALAAALWGLWARPRLFGWTAAGTAVVIVVLGILSTRQTRVWHDSVSLFKHMLAELGDDPYRTDIHLRLGRFYERKQQLDLAAQEYRSSFAANPNRISLRALTLALQAQGKFDEALQAYAEVLQRVPDAEVHCLMAEMLHARGRSGEAIVHYRAALELHPGLWPELTNLAWLLATDPAPQNRDGKESVRLAEQACALAGPRETLVVRTLAAAYAEAGRFEDAVATANKARKLALASGQTDLAEKNQRLIELFTRRLPYREAAGVAHANVPTR
jgi:protein O-mannosyl-transferase